MPVKITPIQAVALAQLAQETGSVMQLHQVGEDPGILVTTRGQGEPDLRIRSDGTSEVVKAPVGER